MEIECTWLDICESDDLDIAGVDYIIFFIVLDDGGAYFLLLR